RSAWGPSSPSGRSREAAPHPSPDRPVRLRRRLAPDQGVAHRLDLLREVVGAAPAGLQDLERVEAHLAADQAGLVGHLQAGAQAAVQHDEAARLDVEAGLLLDLADDGPAEVLALAGEAARQPPLAD